MLILNCAHLLQEGSGTSRTPLPPLTPQHAPLYYPSPPAGAVPDQAHRGQKARALVGTNTVSSMPGSMFTSISQPQRSS